jgi:hypothetical protein
MANADEYERAITAAEINPGGLTARQKELLRKLLKEHGERGNRARAVFSE